MQLAVLAASALVLGSWKLASAQDGELIAPGNFSATVSLTTDYIFRGISNSDETAAIQGSLDWAYDGFYVGVWASTIDFDDPDGSIEVDYYGGYGREIAGIGFDAGLIYYSYPGADAEPDFDYLEAHLGGSYTYDGIPVSPTIGVGVFYSPNFLGEDDDAWAPYGNVGLSLPLEVSLSAEFGYQNVEGDRTTPRGYDYNWWSVGISRDLVGFTLDLTYYDTSDTSGDVECGDLCDARAVFTVSRGL